MLMHLYFAYPATHNNMRVRAKKIKRKEKGYVQHNLESEGLQLYIIYSIYQHTHHTVADL